MWWRALCQNGHQLSWILCGATSRGGLDFQKLSSSGNLFKQHLKLHFKWGLKYEKSLTLESKKLAGVVMMRPSSWGLLSNQQFCNFCYSGLFLCLCFTHLRASTFICQEAVWKIQDRSWRQLLCSLREINSLCSALEATLETIPFGYLLKTLQLK